MKFLVFKWIEYIINTFFFLHVETIYTADFFFLQSLHYENQHTRRMTRRQSDQCTMNKRSILPFAGMCLPEKPFRNLKLLFLISPHLHIYCSQ